MNLRKNMIIANGNVVTPNVSFCKYNRRTKKYDITFTSGKVYSYNYNSFAWLKNPTSLDLSSIKITYNNNTLIGVSEVYAFKNKASKYWHICFQNGKSLDCREEELEIAHSILKDKGSIDVFSYFKESSSLVGPTGEDGTKLLSKQYENIGIVDENRALSSYINPRKYSIKQHENCIPIFPFGCNASQYQAVCNALENQISLIQGPPGTGKTQTILNIIANLIIKGKTVQVVSNNNSATLNVLHKLMTYDLGFLVAPLGNSENKALFIEGQADSYPEIIQSWKLASKDNDGLLLRTLNTSDKLKRMFELKERLAVIKQSLQELEVEFKYFEKYLNDTKGPLIQIPKLNKLNSDDLLKLWGELQVIAETRRRPSLWFKLRCWFSYGIRKKGLFKNDIGVIIKTVQSYFYSKKREELVKEINSIETRLQASNEESITKELSDCSLTYLKAYLFGVYGNKKKRKAFSKKDLLVRSNDVMREYPVVLSSTYSSRSSFGREAVFDYVIVDEASQVDVSTGALALSSANNAVIVGDAKQLPNVVSNDLKEDLQGIFKCHNISKHYSYAENSFLQSVCGILPKIPLTLLREHYRCHPKIINFCNQKFYDGDLLIMTEDDEAKNVISVTKTVVGNHIRGRMNQRQVDVLVQEVLPKLPYSDDKIGIIAPYNDQVDAIRAALFGRNIEVATVHKYQGREKEVIIISTVDDKVKEFSDDPNLLNVAVSRAKNNLHLIVSGNKQPKNSNIRDLIDYIEYNNFSVVKSSIYSVFDYLYCHYTSSRINYLNKHKKVSQYDSENLMFGLISDILAGDEFSMLNVVSHQPLNMLIRDMSHLIEEERMYVLNNATHLDFLIYNRISKKPVLAVEVDGFRFHKKGSKQHARDLRKDYILGLYEIPYIRFATNESGEREKLIAKLNELLVA